MDWTLLLCGHSRNFAFHKSNLRVSPFAALGSPVRPVVCPVVSSARPRGRRVAVLYGRALQLSSPKSSRVPEPARQYVVIPYKCMRVFKYVCVTTGPRTTTHENDLSGNRSVSRWDRPIRTKRISTKKTAVFRTNACSTRFLPSETERRNIS